MRTVFSLMFLLHIWDCPSVPAFSKLFWDLMWRCGWHGCRPWKSSNFEEFPKVRWRSPNWRHLCNSCWLTTRSTHLGTACDRAHHTEIRILLKNLPKTTKKPHRFWFRSGVPRSSLSCRIWCFIWVSPCPHYCSLPASWASDDLSMSGSNSSRLILGFVHPK